MLPCNVTVEETEKGATVHLVNPRAILLSNPILAANDAMKKIAQDAYVRLSNVAETLNKTN